MRNLIEEYLDCIVTLAALVCAMIAFLGYVEKIFAYL